MSSFLAAKRPTLAAAKFDTRAGAAPIPVNFDHFNFSNLWLATNRQPNLPIHLQAAYLVDLDTRLVLWQRHPDTSRAPASLTKLITAIVAVDDSTSLNQAVIVTKATTQ